jgi:hypothetical protein
LSSVGAWHGSSHVSIAKRPRNRAIIPDDLARIPEISDREGATIAKTTARLVGKLRLAWPLKNQNVHLSRQQ